MNEVLLLYLEKVNLYNTQLAKARAKLVNLGIWRLMAFTAAVICFYLFFTGRSNLFLLSGSLALFVFLFLVRKYQDMSDEKLLTEKLLFINQNEAGILNGEPNKFDAGLSFDVNEKYYTDLDVFGEQSIYHLLNRTATSIGSKTLAGYLKKSSTDKNEILSLQESIKELRNQADQRQLLTAKGLVYTYSDSDLIEIEQWLNEKEVIVSGKWITVARWLLPAINIITIIYWIITGNYYPFTVSAAINWSQIGRFAKHTLKQHQLMSKKQEILDQYAAVLKTFAGFHIQKSELAKRLKEISLNAYAAIKQLSGISSFFDQRLNMLVAVFLNTVLLYDIQCLWWLEKWRATYKEKFSHWLAAAGQMEFLNSMATFAYNNPAYCFPEVKTGNPFIKASGISHPLINEKERVKNDFAIGMEDKLQLITGSNMSGKTTFLRSVGVNILLAQCGAPVCADAFEFTPVQILSSIRISDSLQEHTSYFMAELKKLHYIMESLQTGAPSLVLIDEILRGTNSDDKSHGSEQFIKKIIPASSITLFATHDLSLGNLEKEYPGIVRNYCFESIIQNGELSFDYKLHHGIAQNKNASFLMEKMGII